jgi:hypothetical protein
MTISKPLLTTTGILVSLSLAAIAQERKLNRSQLPPGVEKTVQAQSQGAKIKGFYTERERGKKVYEVEMIVNGHTRDIQIAESGTLNEVEEEVLIGSLSPEIRTALRKKASGATILKVESLTKDGVLVAYEAATLKGSKKGEIQVGPSGKSLSRPE